MRRRGRASWASPPISLPLFLLGLLATIWYLSPAWMPIAVWLGLIR